MKTYLTAASGLVLTLVLGAPVLYAGQQDQSTESEHKRGEMGQLEAITGTEVVNKAGETKGTIDSIVRSKASGESFEPEKRGSRY